MEHSKVLLKEIELLGHKHGIQAQIRTYQVLTEIVRWARESGHGNITLSAIDHIFSEKIKTETYIRAAVN